MASDSDFPEESPAPDPVIEGHVEDSFAPFEQILPPEVLACFKDFVGDALATHDIASFLVDQTRDWVPGATSGEQTRDGTPIEATAPAPEGKEKKTGGGR